MMRTNRLKTTSSVEELRDAVHNCVFSCLGSQEGYDNIFSILENLRTIMHFLDGEVEARRHGYASFEEFITSDVMHGYLSIDYLERRPVFFRALPNEWDRELYDIIVASRKHKERIREQAARRQSTDVDSALHSFASTSQSVHFAHSADETQQRSNHRLSSTDQQPPVDMLSDSSATQLQQPAAVHAWTPVEESAVRDSECATAAIIDVGELIEDNMPKFLNVPGDAVNWTKPPIDEVPVGTAHSYEDLLKYVRHRLVVIAWRVRPHALLLAELDLVIRREDAAVGEMLRRRWRGSLKHFINAKVYPLKIVKIGSQEHVVWNEYYCSNFPGWPTTFSCIR